MSLEKAEVLKKLAVTAYILLEKADFEIKKECGESMADRITFKDEDLAKFSMELAFAELIVAMEKAIATGLVDGNRLQECESAVRGSLDSNALTDDLSNVPLEHFSK